MIQFFVYGPDKPVEEPVDIEPLNVVKENKAQPIVVEEAYCGPKSILLCIFCCYWCAPCLGCDKREKIEYVPDSSSFSGS